MSLQEAIEADRRGEYVRAAAAYEESLQQEPSLRTLLNLAILYWDATDTGTMCGYSLEPEFVAKASQRYPELLEQAARLYPQSSEPRFWRAYIRSVSGEEELTSEVYRQFIRDDPTATAPYMCILGRSEGREGREEAGVLLERSQKGGTALDRYVAGVITGILSRLGGSE